jgi:CBS domain-containing protein
MSAPLVSCRPGDRLADAARMMVANGVHALLVVDDQEDGGPWGVLTDLDVLAGGLTGAGERTAGDASSPATTILAADRPAELAAQLMVERGSHHVVVVAPGTRRPVGVLSSLDLLRHAGGRGERTGGTPAP